MKLQLRREGAFAVLWSGSNRNQCGPKGETILHYDVKIIAHDHNLDSQGFILDNNKIQDYFTTNYNSLEDFQSCERIATKACKDLAYLCQARSLVGIAVTISATPNSGITAVWRPE